MKKQQFLLFLLLATPFFLIAQTSNPVLNPLNVDKTNNAYPAFMSTVQNQDGTIETTLPYFATSARNPAKLYDTLVVVLDKYYEWVSDVNFDGDQTWFLLKYFDFNSNNIAYIELPHDTYNIVTVLIDDFSKTSIVIHEDFIFNSTDTLYISENMATNELLLDPRSIDDEPLGGVSGIHRTLYTFKFSFEDGWALSSYFLSPSEYRISDFNGSVEMYFGEFLSNHLPHRSFYLIEYPTPDSINSTHTFTNDPLNFAGNVFQFNAPGGSVNKKIGIGIFAKFVDGLGRFWISGSISYNNTGMNNWQCTFYSDLIDNDDFGYAAKLYFKYDYNNYCCRDSIYTELIDGSNDSMAMFRHFQPYADVHHWNYNDTCFINLGPQTYLPRWSNSNIAINSAVVRRDMNGSYLNGENAFESWAILNEASDTVATGVGLNIPGVIVNEGSYSTVQTYTDCSFGDFKGTTVLKANFNTRIIDKKPPPIRLMYLTDGGNKIRFKFNHQDEVFLHFSASDFKAYDYFYQGINFQPVNDELTEVFVKPHNEEEWMNVDFSIIHQDTIIGSTYLAKLSDYLMHDSALYDLKIKIIDLAGNSSEYTYLPAFVWGDYVLNTSESTQGRGVFTIHPNPATSKIYLSFNQAKNNAGIITIYKISGEIAIEEAIPMAEKVKAINISHLKQGLYIVSYRDIDGNMCNQKLVKH
jgi:hypothetical protein